MMKQRQQGPRLQAQALFLLLLALSATLLQTASAFLVLGFGGSRGLQSPGTGMAAAVGRQRGVVVAMAKGKGGKSSKRSSGGKGKGGFGNQPAPEPQQQESSGEKATTTKEEEEEEDGFSILGSGEPVRSAKGFGAPPKPLAKDVDAAYEQALSKIKGEPSKPKPAFPGSGGPGGAENSGKVPVRNVDIFDILPESVQNGFETTLIAALALNLLVIIGLGIGFSVQAIPTSNLDLPESVLGAAKAVRPVVEQWEFLFTPSLISFFVVSSLLGSFKIAQLGKGGTTYREK